MAVNGEPSADIEGSVLLDTNVLIPLLLGNIETYGDIMTRLKIAALTCRYFLVTEATLEELQRWARATSRKFGLSNQPPESIGLAFDISNIERSVNAGTEQLLKRSVFRVINESELIRSVRQANIPGWESIVTKYMLQSEGLTHPNSVEHDARLILTAKTLSLPILTMDKDIIVMAGEAISELEVPFPFDVDAIDEIELDELIDLAAPMRNLYRKAFIRLNEDVSTHEDLRANLQNREGFIVKQHNIMEELSAELQEAQAASKQWQDLAKPRANEAIIWTIVETLLGLAPFPVPTTPVTFFVQVVKYRKVEKQQQSQPHK